MKPKITSIGKRLLDLFGAVVLLALLSPILLLVGVTVRVVMGRPVLFRQMRPGLFGRPFMMLKFRTMRDSRDPAGRVRPDAERITTLGRLLRASSLDELPELINVVRGDMSLVGPRPLLVEYLPLYSSRQAKRHEMRPGITGWAQINGRNALSWEERLELDVWYVENQTLALDLTILFKTIGQVMKRRGISHPGEATMHPFTGGNRP